MIGTGKVESSLARLVLVLEVAVISCHWDSKGKKYGAGKMMLVLIATKLAKGREREKGSVSEVKSFNITVPIWKKVIWLKVQSFTD